MVPGGSLWFTSIVPYILYAHERGLKMHMNTAKHTTQSTISTRDKPKKCIPMNSTI